MKVKFLKSGLPLLATLLSLSFSIGAAADGFSENQSIYTRWGGTEASTVQNNQTVFYLYNVGTGRFLAAGGLWGTEAMLQRQDYGMPFTWQTESGRTYIKSNVTTTDGAYALNVNKFGWTTQKTDDHYDGVQLDGKTSGSFSGISFTVSTQLTRVDGETGTTTYTYYIKQNITSGSNNGTFYIGAGYGDQPFRSMDYAAYRQDNGSLNLKDSVNYQWRIVTQQQFEEAVGASDATAYDGLAANVSYLLHDIFFDRGNTGFNNWTVENSDNSTPSATEGLYDWSYANIGSDKGRFLKFGKEGTWNGGGIGRYSSNLKWNTAIFRKMEPLYNGTYGWAGNFPLAMQRARYEFGTLEGQGSAYQTITFTKAGNYQLSCEGFSSNGDYPGQLFVQKADGSSVNSVNLPTIDANTSSALYHQGDKQGTGKYSYATTVNALDDWPAVGQILYDNEGGRYTVSVIFNVSDDDVANKTQFRVGVKKDNALKSYEAWDANSDANQYYFDQSYAAIDNMELHYIGDKAPFLLDEDKTPFDSYYKTAAGEDAGSNTNRTVYLKRTMTAGKWTSIMLPVPLSTAQFYASFGADAKLGTLSGVSSEEPAITQQTRIDFRLKKLNPEGVAMYADSFYLIKPSIEPTEVVYSNYPIKVYLLGRHNLELKDEGNDNNISPLQALTRGILETNGRNNYYQPYYEYGGYLKNEEKAAEANEDRAFTIYGTYTTMKDNAYTSISQTAPSAMHQDAYYVASDGNMYHITSANYRIQGFRGWIVANSKEAKAKGITFNILSEDSGTTTGIKIINVDENINEYGKSSKALNGVYSISGQRIADADALRSLPKGLYIVNGHKVVVK